MVTGEEPDLRTESSYHRQECKKTIEQIAGTQKCSLFLTNPAKNYMYWCSICWAFVTPAPNSIVINRIGLMFIIYPLITEFKNHKLWEPLSLSSWLCPKFSRYYILSSIGQLSKPQPFTSLIHWKLWSQWLSSPDTHRRWSQIISHPRHPRHFTWSTNFVWPMFSFCELITEKLGKRAPSPKQLLTRMGQRARQMLRSIR